MLDAAVNMLGPYLDPVAEALCHLGAQHVNFGVLSAHYGIVGEALLCTLATALGDKWTPEVKKGWTGIYTFVSSNMMLGADRRITDKKEKRIILEAAKKKALRETSRLSKRRLSMEHIHAPKQSHDIRSIIDQALNVSQHPANIMPRCDDSTVLPTSTRTASTTVDANEVLDIDIVEAVDMSWVKVKSIPNYEEVAGVLLFKK